MAALNSQTAVQFQQYAAQQYPGNFEQQQILIRQLQEQHYQQYMQQLYQVQLAQQQVCHQVLSFTNTTAKTSLNWINRDWAWVIYSLLIMIIAKLYLLGMMFAVISLLFFTVSHVSGCPSCTFFVSLFSMLSSGRKQEGPTAQHSRSSKEGIW